MLLFFFFFNDTATTEIYTLSLHDALPILYTLFHKSASLFGSCVALFLGPHSMAKCGISPFQPHDLGTSGYKVTYIPVETGIYSIHVSVEGKPIEGLTRYQSPAI